VCSTTSVAVGGCGGPWVSVYVILKALYRAFCHLFGAISLSILCCSASTSGRVTLVEMTHWLLMAVVSTPLMVGG
jgi:hypothetical protein